MGVGRFRESIAALLLQFALIGCTPDAQLDLVDWYQAAVRLKKSVDLATEVKECMYRHGYVNEHYGPICAGENGVKFPACYNRP